MSRLSTGKGDAEKARYWQRTIREAVRSGMSIWEFCRQHRLKESQFYWWQGRLKAGREEEGRRQRSLGHPQASFALVSDDTGATDAGIELVLGNAGAGEPLGGPGSGTGVGGTGKRERRPGTLMPTSSRMIRRPCGRWCWGCWSRRRRRGG
jgi:hypothetical protein